MNYSEHEQFDVSDEDEPIIAAGLNLLPVIGKTLYAAISDLGQTYRLTPAQVKVLLHLSARGQMTIGEIASSLGASMPATSEMVDRLVDAGHLVRIPCPADRRRVLIEATPRSQRIGQRLRALRTAQLRSALLQIPPAERSAFIRGLEALVFGLTHPCPSDVTGWSDDEARTRDAPSAAADRGAGRAASTPDTQHRAPEPATAPAPARFSQGNFA